MDPRTAVFEAVEGIARLYERSMLTRSPLHLAACGGCGGPTFQQPCPLCSYYPMGSDKGHWHPHAATREFFCEKVAASAPDGTGNLATWVLGQKKRTVAYKEDASFKVRLEDALSFAIGMATPEPGLVFDLVAGAKTSVSRERSGRDVWSFWEVVDAHSACSPGSTPGPPTWSKRWTISTREISTGPAPGSGRSFSKKWARTPDVGPSSACRSARSIGSPLRKRRPNRRRLGRRPRRLISPGAI